MTRCRRCNQPLKERAVSDSFTGRNCQVHVVGIPAIVCGACGYQGVSADTLSEIEMFIRPVLAGRMGAHLMGAIDLTIDLGHPQYASATDIADRPFPEGPIVEMPVFRTEMSDLGSLDLAEITLAAEEARAA